MSIQSHSQKAEKKVILLFSREPVAVDELAQLALLQSEKCKRFLSTLLQ